MPSTAESGSYEIARWAPSVRAYGQWIDPLDYGAARLWARRLKSEDEATVEGAVAEAVAWDFLAHRVDSIEPGSLSEGGPDFRCASAGNEFLVEVTNLARSTVTKRTRLPETPSGFQWYGDLTGLIKSEVSRKAGQGAFLQVPYVVMVTTLHSGARVCFSRSHIQHVLHSTTALTGDFDSERGEVVGPLRDITRMELSAFTRKYSAEPMRRNVSAALVGDFGSFPIKVLGVLHPDPVRRFDPSSLPGVPFSCFRIWPPDPRILVEWTDGQSGR